MGGWRAGFLWLPAALSDHQTLRIPAPCVSGQTDDFPRVKGDPPPTYTLCFLRRGRSDPAQPPSASLWTESLSVAPGLLHWGYHIIRGFGRGTGYQLPALSSVLLTCVP